MLFFKIVQQIGYFNPQDIWKIAQSGDLVTHTE